VQPCRWVARGPYNGTAITRGKKWVKAFRVSLFGNHRTLNASSRSWACFQRLNYSAIISKRAPDALNCEVLFFCHGPSLFALHRVHGHSVSNPLFLPAYTTTPCVPTRRCAFDSALNSVDKTREGFWFPWPVTANVPLTRS
jgi:hypothetical protein